MDLIIGLTEGLVSDIAKSKANNIEREDDLRLIATYVESPLVWAISTGSKSEFQNVDSLNGHIWGVSRLTSGSHLMALVLGHQKGWDLERMRFEPLGSFESLRAGVNVGSAAAFMWETFTSKPYHDAGEVKRIGETTTPWPCFMIAAPSRVDKDASTSLAITRALTAVREACQLFHAEIEQSTQIVAQRYSLKPEDAAAWFSAVKITCSEIILQPPLERAIEALKNAKVISAENTCQPSDLLDLKRATLANHDIPLR